MAPGWRPAAAVIWGLTMMTGWPPPGWAGADFDAMASIPSGGYVPFFTRQDKTGKPLKRSVPMAAFRLDRYPVTNRQYLAFVERHPEWQKSKAKAVFVDSHYLDGWPDDRSWGESGDATRPVTSVSWFAANAYCQAQGKSLPTTDQWEYALADGGRGKAAVTGAVLQWYGKPNSDRVPPIEQATKNGSGVYGLVGLVWEWTQDFNSVMSGAELRQTGNDKGQFCGGSGQNTSDASDYAAFMRFSMRSSLKATYTTPNLGFRCAKEKS